MPNPTRRHQGILLNLAEQLHAYERRTHSGKTIIAPSDILIRRAPLRIRQPDVLFISNERLAQCGKDTDPAPLTTAPELVVEVLSPSDTGRVLEGKLADYRAVGVQECWGVHTNTQKVEVLRLILERAETVATYSGSETLQSATLPGLTLPVAALFAA